MNESNMPAFPSHGTMGEVVETGLTKREYFAGLAMQGMNANAEFTQNTAAERASFAVTDADALLAELERTK